ncbi:uncharacterized protein LOC132749112 [Ruditapes philippinarum]|uniref:uncharacterized protein LOC132749112 n=1 Tax=Ruditapes philippinarum TaxID=129788 RepID=UPI00295A89C4|nr:uncharacterized protein LOC132749112 [Ruditapes philippinarum]XP_060594781.1 uncharacterized protein LOC132749112 [Ruditapes philippinarum]
MKMTDVLNPTVCFGKNVVQSKSVKESMCNTDLPVALKEDVESGSNDDLDTDKLIPGNRTVFEKVETEEINSLGGKYPVFVAQNSKVLNEKVSQETIITKEVSGLNDLLGESGKNEKNVCQKKVNNEKDVRCLDTALNTLHEMEPAEITKDVVKRNRKYVVRRKLNGNIDLTKPNIGVGKDTKLSGISEDVNDRNNSSLKFDVEETKKRLKRGKLFPIRIEEDKGYDISEDDMGFTDDSDDDPDCTDLDKLFLNRITDVNLKENVKDLLKFAEVLYKCTLCTSIPSILTSEESFIKHVNRQHLSEDNHCHTCKMCLLKFRTEEDLKEHVIYSHTGSEENLSSDLTGSDITGSHDQVIDSNNDSDSDSSGHRQLRAKVIKRSKPVQDFESPKQLVDHTGIETLNGSLDLTQRHFDEKQETDCANGSKSCKEVSEIDIKQITDQIIKSDVQGRNVSQGGHSKLPFIPGFTLEFGKYTKLVREGGNIVYFCQICNWKSPIKTTFEVHCNMSSHKNKVFNANNPDDSYDSSLKSPKYSEKNHCLFTKTDHTKDKGKRSYVNKNISVGPRMPDQNLFYDYIMRPRGGNQYRGKTPVVSPYGTSSFIEDARFTYKRPNEHPVDLAMKKRKRNIKHSDVGHKSDSESDDSSDIKNCFLSKYNHSSNMTLLRQKLLEGSCGKKMKNNGKEFKYVVTNSRCSSDLSANENSKDSNHYERSSLKNEKLEDLMSESKETNSEHKVRNNVSSSLGRDGISCSASSVLKYRAKDDIKFADSLFTIYKCHACSFRYSDVNEYEKHFDKEHKSSVANFVILQKGNPESKQPMCSQGHREIETGSGFMVESGLGMEGRDLFAGRNGDQPVSGSCEMGENWRVQKLKEVLPDFVIECDRGNTSRDYLLQCISSSSGIQDAVLWSSACNRAMRELFPNSQAQRKGKYKKTYYFGISLLDVHQIQEEPPGLEGESLLYQPHRDINIDMDKIVEHLPSILRWTGNMESGVHRQDLLILLCEAIQDTDASNWGAQCNRAIRLVFPNIDMKRKGKYKATMYLGVEFQRDVLKRLSKYRKGCVDSKGCVDLKCIDSSSRKSPVQNLVDNLKDHKRVKTLERLLTRNSSCLEIVPQREETVNEKCSTVINHQWIKENDQIEIDDYLSMFGGVSMFKFQNGVSESKVFKENVCDKESVDQSDEKCDEEIQIDKGDDNDGDDEEESLDNVQSCQGT